MFEPILYGKSPAKTVLIHGGPADPGNISILGQHLTISSGSSLQVYQDKTNIKSLIDSIHEQIDQSGEEKVILVGHSFGAWIAGIYAATYSEKIKKAVLVSCGPLKTKYEDSIHKTRLKRLSETDGKEYLACLDLIFNYDIPRAKLALRRITYFTGITDYYKPIRKHDFSPPLDINVFRSQLSEMNEWRKSGKLLDAFSKIKCPLSFIHGDYDPHPQKGITEPLIEKGIKHAFHNIRHCGHEPWMEVEKASEFYQIIEEEIKMA